MIIYSVLIVIVICDILIYSIVIDYGLYAWKAFFKVKIGFIHPLWMMANLAIRTLANSNKQ